MTRHQHQAARPPTTPAVVPFLDRAVDVTANRYGNTDHAAMARLIDRVHQRAVDIAGELDIVEALALARDVYTITATH